MSIDKKREICYTSIIAPLWFFDKREGFLMKEMSEEEAQKQQEEARKNIVRFITDTRVGSSSGAFFGIDIGPGLPPYMRLIVHSSYYSLVRHNRILVKILLDERNPFVFIQRISFEDFLLAVPLVIRGACARYGFEFVSDVYNMRQSNLAELEKHILTNMERLSIFQSIDSLNFLIGRCSTNPLL
jgi:hypothetical protein